MLTYADSAPARAQEIVAERRRRIDSYASQYDRWEQEHGSPALPGQRLGGVARPIHCENADPRNRAGRADGDPLPACSFFSPMHAARYFVEYVGEEPTAENLDMMRRNVLRAVRLGTRCCRTKFRLIEGAPVVLAATGRERRVRCVETGERFGTVSDAARAAGVPVQTFWERLQDGLPCGGAGRHYAYADRGAE